MSRTTTWQALADECRLMDDGEGWAFAERVACAVEKGSAGRPSNRSERSDSGKATGRIRQALPADRPAPGNDRGSG